MNKTTDTSPCIIDGEEMQVGYRSYRLKTNDPYYKKEIAFVKAVNKEIKDNSAFLSQIVGKPEDGPGLTLEEEKIALSIIQWLGTPVGQGFLEKVEKI